MFFKAPSNESKSESEFERELKSQWKSNLNRIAQLTNSNQQISELKDLINTIKDFRGNKQNPLLRSPELDSAKNLLRNLLDPVNLPPVRPPL
tara:strand:+ start:1132 stop:1407 length:276 start_codon:yes stop_codon:yes gene_type:complete